MSKRLLFPFEHDFRWFFTTITADKAKAPPAFKHKFSDYLDFNMARPPHALMKIGPYCATPDYQGLWVLAKQDVLSAIVANTINISDDVMTFKVTDRGTGYGLLSCEHSKILGGVWLAEVDLATVKA